MNLQLKSTLVESMSIKENDGKIQPEDGFELNFGTAFSQESSNTFQIFFNTALTIEPNDSLKLHCLELKFIALFETDKDITQEFIDSLFPKVNAPAIAYPFFRAFISTTLLNAGYNPVILPSVNFQAMAQNGNNV